MNDLEAAELILDVYREKGSKIGTVEYIIRETDDLRVVAIGGSDGVLDWWRNIQAIPIYSPTLGWVHWGFWLSTSRLWNARRALLTDGKPTLVCGHSKGGAEATLLAAFMAKEGHPAKKLLTFGAPRCGFSGLQSILSVTFSVRCVNRGDPVPMVPPPGFLLRYRHHVDESPTFGDGHSMSEYRDAMEGKP